MEAPARLERRAVAARDRKRHIGELDRATSVARGFAVADAKPPRTSIRVAAERAKLTEIDHRALEAFVPQHLGDRIGDIALRQAVERDRHAGTCEADRGRAGLDAAEINELTRNLARARRDVRLHVGVRPEMRLIEPPQRLHRYVEGAGTQDAETLALLDERAEFARRLCQCADRVETRNLAVITVKAEHPFVAA